MASLLSLQLVLATELQIALFNFLEELWALQQLYHLHRTVPENLDERMNLLLIVVAVINALRRLGHLVHHSM